MSVRGLMFLLLMSVAPAAAQGIFCGDCSQDGVVSIVDALVAAQHATALTALMDPAFGVCNVAGVQGGSTVPGAVITILDALEIARRSAGLLGTLTCMQMGPCGGPLPWESGSYYPPWGSVPPARVLTHAHVPTSTPEQNGDALADAILALQPGDRLEIQGGTYSIDRWFNVVLQGTASAPIFIVAAPGPPVILTRPDANQNVINLGAGGGHTGYLALQGLEITGGDTLIKVYSCAQLWIDQCVIHDGSGVGIAANSEDTDHLHLTRNEIYNPGGPTDSAEGMYLGANNGVVTMSCSTVALNHIHDTAGTQGDGIEVKQGSHSNWIVENHVHDCQYPCIIAYGTDGAGLNLIERNVCYRSGDNTMQVQGEAIVRNNLIMAGATGFHSHDHQGLTRDLVVVHNTIVNTTRATNLSSWDGRVGMVLSGNAIYSQSAESIRFPSGSAGVTVTANVVLGPVSGVGSGFLPGTGLGDFVALAWDGTSRDGTPTAGSPLLGVGDPAFMVPEDLSGAPRTPPADAGAFERP